MDSVAAGTRESGYVDQYLLFLRGLVLFHSLHPHELSALCQIDGFQVSLFPGLYVCLDICIIDIFALRQVMAFLQHDLFGIGQDDPSKANIFEGADGSLDLAPRFSGAVVGIECLLEQKAQDWVAIRAQDERLRVGEDSHDAQ